MKLNCAMRGGLTMYARKYSDLPRVPRHYRAYPSEPEFPVSDRGPDRILGGVRGLLFAGALSAPLWIAIYLLLR
jgi:hypothetical protein